MTKLTNLDFKYIGKSDTKTISLIAQKAYTNFKQYLEMGAVTISVLDIMMDIEAVHEYMPLDLEAFLNADEENFNHDVIGIIRHLNRETKLLEQCFVPRFAK